MIGVCSGFGLCVGVIFGCCLLIRIWFSDLLRRFVVLLPFAIGWVVVVLLVLCGWVLVSDLVGGCGWLAGLVGLGRCVVVLMLLHV